MSRLPFCDGNIGRRWRSAGGAPRLDTRPAADTGRHRAAGGVDRGRGDPALAHAEAACEAAEDTPAAAAATEGTAVVADVRRGPAPRTAEEDTSRAAGRRLEHRPTGDTVDRPC